MKPVFVMLAAFAVALIAAVSSPLMVAAQEESGWRSLIFDGHALDFPADLADSLSILLFDQPTENENLLEQAPRIHIRIGGVIDASLPVGSVEIYRLDEVDGFQAGEAFSTLREILDERPDLDEYIAENELLPTTFPFIEINRPVYTFSTRASYFETADYSGVVSINARIYAMSSGIVFMRYNLEAISKDGVWGLTARFDLRGEYPETLVELGDPELYLEAVKTFLADSPSDAFTPSLDVLDEVLLTIRRVEE